MRHQDHSRVRADVVERLSALGVPIDPSLATLEWRDWRWVLRIGADRICFYAEADDARMRLAREATLLTALQGRLPCEVPSVLAADAALQARSMIRGDPIEGREPEIGKAAGWERLAASYGAGIASLHGAMAAAEAAAFVQSEPDSLPYPAARIRPLVERYIEDRGLARDVGAIVDSYAAIVVVPADRVLVHGDLIAGNIAVDLATMRLVGLFDFSDAGVADRHRDLNYVHSFGRPFAERLMDAYEARAQVALDRRRPAIYHVASAISHLVDGDTRSQKARVNAWVRQIVDIAF